MDWWKDDQALAYAIAEQGRASCDGLLDDARTPLDARRLHAAHDGFGLAGYAVSDHLLRGVRPAVWLLVDEAGPSPLCAEGSEGALLLAVHAAAAVERCFEIPWLLGQMQTAHRALRQAHRALTAMVGVEAAARLTIDAIHDGQLEREWQQRHLRPPGLTAAAAARAAAA